MQMKDAKILKLTESRLVLKKIKGQNHRKRHVLKLYQF